jgi:hypothetical protein
VSITVGGYSEMLTISVPITWWVRKFEEFFGDTTLQVVSRDQVSCYTFWLEK